MNFRMDSHQAFIDTREIESVEKAHPWLFAVYAAAFIATIVISAWSQT